MASSLLSGALPPALKGIQDDLVMEDMVFLVALMRWFEKTKKELVKGNDEAAAHGTVAQSKIVNAAVKLFQWADSEDRAGHHNKDNVVTAFYTAGMLLDVSSVFAREMMNKDVAQQKKYAKWRAAHLYNCLNSGGTPSVPVPKPEERANNLEVSRIPPLSSEQPSKYQEAPDHHSRVLQDAPAVLPTTTCSVPPSGPAASSSSAPTNDLEKVERILKKMTPETFDKQLAKIQSLNMDTEEGLAGVVELIFEKAINEPFHSSMYAKMCQIMSTKEVPSSANSSKSTNFRKMLLTLCQKEFELGEHVGKIHSITRNVQDEKKKKELEDLIVNRYRSRSFGNVSFIGELFKVRILSVKTMHQCILQLLSRPEEDESIECLCLLLSTIGKELETPMTQPSGTRTSTSQSRETMNQYFRSLDAIVQKGKISNEIRAMIQDVVDLRKNQWEKPPPRSENDDSRGTNTVVDTKQATIPRALLAGDTQDNRTEPDGPANKSVFLPPKDGYRDLSFSSFQSLMRSSQDSLLVMGRRAEKEVSSPTSTVVDSAVTTLASAVPHDDGENRSVTSKSTTLRYSGKDDQRSLVTNPEGKKVYDRLFLLELENSPASLKKPDGLPSLEVIVRDKTASKEMVPKDLTPPFLKMRFRKVKPATSDIVEATIKKPDESSLEVVRDRIGKTASMLKSGTVGGDFTIQCQNPVVNGQPKQSAQQQSVQVVPPFVVAGMAPAQPQPHRGGDMSSGSGTGRRQRSIALRIVDVNTNRDVLTGEEVPPSVNPPTTAGPTDHGIESTLTKSALPRPLTSRPIGGASTNPSRQPAPQAITNSNPSLAMNQQVLFVINEQYGNQQLYNPYPGHQFFQAAGTMPPGSVAQFQPRAAQQAYGSYRPASPYSGYPIQPTPAVYFRPQQPTQQQQQQQKAQQTQKDSQNLQQQPVQVDGVAGAERTTSLMSSTSSAARLFPKETGPQETLVDEHKDLEVSLKLDATSKSASSDGIKAEGADKFGTSGAHSTESEHRDVQDWLNRARETLLKARVYNFQSQLEQYLRGNQIPAEDVGKWIENRNFGEVDSTFVRALVTAVTRSSIDGHGTESKLNTAVFQHYTDVLRRYVENIVYRELELLVAVQTLVTQLKHPKGLMKEILEILYASNVVSDNGFQSWLSINEPWEGEGKTIALEIVLRSL